MEERTEDQLAEEYRRAAKHLWETGGEIEIDPDAIVSFSADDGAYVQAWVWVDRSETNITEEEHEGAV